MHRRPRPTDLARALWPALSLPCVAALAQPPAATARPQQQQQQAGAPLPADAAPPGAADKSPTAAAKMSTTDFARAVINARPEPCFTDEGRLAAIQGVVRLRVTLTRDGRVAYPLILRPLTHGLTVKSLRAALNIKFTPAQKDGRPVAQAVTLEYNFNVF